MKRKYSIITGFMGKVQDRFIDYQPPRDIKDMIEMASRVKGCSGLELWFIRRILRIRRKLNRYWMHMGLVCRR